MSDDEKKLANTHHTDAEDYDFAYRLLQYGRWLYRYVSDGIAWRAFNFNREIIRALGAKESVPFLSKSGGLENETRIFKAIRKQGREWLPIMHDLTNCLRTSDFSVFRNSELVEVIELKVRQSSSSVHLKDIPILKNSREGRQAKRRKNLEEFMVTGDLALLHPELERGRSLRSNMLERHNYPAISKVITSARWRGYGYKEPEPGLMYIAWKEQSQSVEQVLLNVRKNKPQFFSTLFTFRSISPRFELYHDILPITAMDLPYRDITDLIFSRIGLICLVNYSSVETWCRAYGIPLTFHHSPHKEIKITVDSKPHGGEVREGLWDRLLLEALSLRSFADLIKAIIDDYDLSIT